MTLQAAPHDDRWGPRRARLVAGVLAVVFTVIVGRSAQIAFNGPHDADAAVAANVARRADIVDRNGDLLATSLPAWSLSADPRAIWDARETAEAIASVMPGTDVKDLTARLSDRDRHFVWIQRGMTPRQRQAIFDLGLEGLRFDEEMRRVYPGGKLAGHLIGYTNVDGKGVEGMEHAFNDRLTKGGEPLRLTIDAGVQYALEAELERAFEEFDMKGAAGVVVDSSTGAVRAIASWPGIDPNHPGAADESVQLNKATGAVYELGSIYKPLTVAAAIETGVVGVTDVFDISAPLKVGAATVRDPHVFDHAHAVSVEDILAYSSNIGAAEIGQRLGPGEHKAFLGRLGLLAKLEYAGPPSAAPITPRNWDALTLATVSYGHGIAVSPLAFAMTYTPFANGGELLSPVFLEPVDPAAIEKRRVMSAATARAVTEMLRQTVLIGTGTLAEAPGYEVAGKTGTAEKPGPNGYQADKNITSFAAVFPASRPQFVVLVVLDEAQPRSGDARTAAYTAAAIVGRLVARAAPMLDVAPVLQAPADAPRQGLRPATTGTTTESHTQ